MAVQQSDRIEDLLKAGRKAAKAGDRALANARYRKAAELSPYDERVWLALLDVVTEDDDRRVCLDNIVRINPGNAKAARQLQALQPPDPQAEAEQRFTKQEQQAKGRRRRLRAFRSGLGLGLLAGFVGTLIGLVLSIFIYGFGLSGGVLDIWFAPLRAVFTQQP
ncbi:MAG TPA: hypothetical protein VER79_04480 [Candidatus Limnocylindrales bacterium]|nr:hypothetical protein [Candidatus Limnocylindrales bacterium]